MRLIVGITGSTGSIHAIRFLEALRRFPEVETHLVVSEWAKTNLALETGRSPEDLAPLAWKVHPCADLSSCLASGSFMTDGMIVLPCSMKTLASIAAGYCDNLISRAADVCIKEGRKLVLCPRETPLSAIHLENMLKLARLGVRMVPPMPAYYNRPTTIEDLVAQHVTRLLDQFGLHDPEARRWNGPEGQAGG